MKTVLIPVNGSESCRRAVRSFIDLAQSAPAMHAIALNVEPAVPLMQLMVDGRPGEVRRIQGPLRDKGEKLLAPVRAELERAGVRHSAFVEFGEPADVIAARAKQWGVDLIVMGAHGRGAIGMLLAGSVTQKVLRHADVPVCWSDDADGRAPRCHSGRRSPRTTASAIERPRIALTRVRRRSAPALRRRRSTKNPQRQRVHETNERRCPGEAREVQEEGRQR